MNKIQIKNYITGEVIYEHEEDANTIKKTVESAVRDGASLDHARLDGARLDGARLDGASLAHASLVVARLDGANLFGACLVGANLVGACLDGANLVGARLDHARLDGARLDHARLVGASLDHARLDGARLVGANLFGACLDHARLVGARLDGANLVGASLDHASLDGARLDGANLFGACLVGAKNIPFIPLACPSDGAFTAWKKVRKDGLSYIVELYIPTKARRSSATTNKCRCDKAKVISITRIDNGEKVERVTNCEHAVTTYEVGCMVTPDSFDENRWNECSHGIHFFINKQEAINY